MAVYTEVTDEELAAFIASYDLGALLSYKGIAEGVENTNYLVHTEKGPFILTLYEKRVAPADLPFFLGLMEHLARPGLTCPTPVRDAQGRMLRDARRPAGGARHLPRRRVDPPAAAAPLRGRRARRWRSCIWPARASRIARANALGLAGWRPLFERFRAARRRGRARARRASSSRSSTHLEAHWPARPAAGRHPRRPVSRQRLLPRRPAVRA